MTYAQQTTVSVGQTRVEIEHTLRRYGAEAFGYMDDGPTARIAFRMKERHFRFILTMPPVKEFETSNTGRQRSPGAKRTAWEQACRSRWRALLLVIRAKLEAVETGIVTLEDEFLAQTVTMTGKTVAEEVQPILEEQYRLGPAHARPLMLEAPR